MALLIVFHIYCKFFNTNLMIDEIQSEEQSSVDELCPGVKRELMLFKDQALLIN